MKHVEKQPLFWPKNPNYKILIFKNQPFQRFLLGLCQKMVLRLKYDIEWFEILGSNCWDKTKENVFSRLL